MRTRLRLYSSLLIIICAVALICAPLSGCQKKSANQVTIAVNAGVEGDALKQAARDYEAQTGARIQIVEFPYDDLFAKELTDLSARTGAYDLIMLDDPWFPRFATADLLTDLAPLYQKRGLAG